MDNNIFAERIKELRQEFKLSQAGFARLISTNQSTLSAYETGDRLPPYETLVTIAQQCQVSIDWLCGISDTKSSTLKVETYSDLIKILMLLDETFAVPTKIEKIEISNPCFLPTYELELRFTDEKLIEFYDEWKDISSIRSKTPSGNKLYDIWLKDTFERYNYALPEHHLDEYDIEDEE